MYLLTTTVSVYLKGKGVTIPPICVLREKSFLFADPNVMGKGLYMPMSTL